MRESKEGFDIVKGGWFLDDESCMMYICIYCLELVYAGCLTFKITFGRLNALYTWFTTVNLALPVFEILHNVIPLVLATHRRFHVVNCPNYPWTLLLAYCHRQIVFVLSRICWYPRCSSWELLVSQEQSTQDTTCGVLTTSVSITLNEAQFPASSPD